MNRLSIVHKIGGLNDQHCKSCPVRPSLATKGQRDRAQNCMKACPIGIEMKQLGDQLLSLSSSRRETKKSKAIKEEQDMSNVKRGPAPKEAPSCGLTKQIYIEQIASGETNASIERAWGMKVNTLYDWIKRWDLKGLKAETAQDLLGLTEAPAPLLRSTSPVAQAIEGKASGLTNINARREAEEVKVLSAKLKDRNAAYDRLLLDFKQLSEKLAEERKIVAEVTEDRDQWKSFLETHKSLTATLERELIETKDMFDKAYARNTSANVTIGEHLQAIAELEDEKRLLLETLEKAATPKTDPNSTYEAFVEIGVLQPVKDNVNHPAHYNAGGIECIDAIEAALTGLTGGQAYSTGAAIKYLWRWSRKNGIEDLEKAAWYVNRLIGEAKVRES